MLLLEDQYVQWDLLLCDQLYILLHLQIHTGLKPQDTEQTKSFYVYSASGLTDTM